MQNQGTNNGYALEINLHSVKLQLPSSRVLFLFLRLAGEQSWLTWGLAAQAGAVTGFFIGVATTGAQASARPSARLPSAHVTGMSLATHATVSVCVREREHEMGGRPSAHTPTLLPAGRTERIVGEVCVCLADACARGRIPRARTHAEAGTRTCMLHSDCRCAETEPEQSSHATRPVC